MKNSTLQNIFFLIAITLIYSCGSESKVVEADANISTAPTSINDQNKEHIVQVIDILDAENYTYLYVHEDGNEFWLATTKIDAKRGEKYTYTGGLLQENFFSQEHQRTFETLYMVSKLKSLSGEAMVNTAPKQTISGFDTSDVEAAPGSIALSELISNKEKYANQKVKVTGKCVKVNLHIMDRHWVHLQDKSGAAYDLTVTTDEVIDLGSVVTFEGTITLDKDFGAGYRYEVIMEEAKSL